MLQSILSRWLDDSEVVEVGRFYRSLCSLVFAGIFLFICSSSLAALTSLPSRRCVGYLISRFEPSYTILGPWWLSCVGCWARSIPPSHRPQLWTWHGRYAPTGQGLNTRTVPLNKMETRMSFSLCLFRSFTYLLVRSTTSPPSKALLRR